VLAEKSCLCDPLGPRSLRLEVPEKSESRPGTRSFFSFSSAVSEIADARVFGGIHFRTSCDLGNTLGRNVADFVARHAMRPLGDDQNDEQVWIQRLRYPTRHKPAEAVALSRTASPETLRGERSRQTPTTSGYSWPNVSQPCQIAQRSAKKLPGRVAHPLRLV